MATKCVNEGDLAGARQIYVDAIMRTRGMEKSIRIQVWRWCRKLGFLRGFAVDSKNSKPVLCVFRNCVIGFFRGFAALFLLVCGFAAVQNRCLLQPENVKRLTRAGRFSDDVLFSNLIKVAEENVCGFAAKKYRFAALPQRIFGCGFAAKDIWLRLCRKGDQVCGFAAVQYRCPMQPIVTALEGLTLPGRFTDDVFGILQLD